MPDAITVITLDTPPPPAPGAIVATDVIHGYPIAVTYAEPPPVEATVLTLTGAITGGGGGPSSGELAAHVADTTPHPAYDDLPSLTLLFQNGLI